MATTIVRAVARAARTAFDGRFENPRTRRQTVDVVRRAHRRERQVVAGANRDGDRRRVGWGLPMRYLTCPECHLPIHERRDGPLLAACPRCLRELGDVAPLWDTGYSSRLLGAYLQVTAADGRGRGMTERERTRTPDPG